MPRKNKKNKLLILIIVAQIYALSFGYAQAKLRIPSPSQVAAELESRYHLNVGTMQNIGESFNVADEKSIAPQLMITFEPMEPKEGQRITAHAIPMYFGNPVEKLYYTWYIKHDAHDRSRGDWNGNDDLNGDGRRNVEDGKIEAMRIIATSGYDNHDDPLPDYGRDGDDDGYEASIGGDDKKGMDDDLKYCYIHDFQTGINSEMVEDNGTSSRCEHLFPDTDGEGVAGDNSFGHTEEEFWRTNPQDANTAANGNLDEANVTGLGQSTFSWTYQKGDQVGVAIEGTSIIPTKYNGSTYMTMWALAKNICSDSSPRQEWAPSCPTGFTPLCGKTVDAYSGADPLTGIATEDFSCSNTKTTPTCSESTISCSDAATPMCIPDASVQSAYFTGNCVLNGSICTTLATGACNSNQDGRCDFLDTVSPINTCSATPTRATCTAQTVDPDDSNGLIQTGTKTVSIEGYGVNIPTTTVDLNDCLEYNLVDPAEKTLEKLDVSLAYTPDNPVNDPSGDAMGDVLSLNAMINNLSNDSGQLRYKWEVKTDEEVGGEFDTDITNELVQDDFLIGKADGINNSTLGIRLNLNENDYDFFDSNTHIGYLKIIVKATESLPGGVRMGKGEVIVRVNSTDKKIRAFLVSSDDGRNLFVRNRSEDLICNSKDDINNTLAYYICPVIKNQILRLETDIEGMDFSWTVNGVVASCDPSMSSDCAGGDVLFLPIVGAEGTTINVKLSAKDMESGRGIEISKAFQIVKPYANVASGNTSTVWPKILGNYSDLDGQQFTDYSDSTFETYTGSQITFAAELHPSWLGNTGSLSRQWLINNADVTNATDPNTVSLSVDADPGAVYDVKFRSLYSSSAGVRKALSNYWDIPPGASDGIELSDSARLNVLTAGPAGTGAFRSPGKFLASILSNLPTQSLFLIRVVLVIFTVVLLSGLAMNTAPSLYRREK